VHPNFCNLSTVRTVGEVCCAGGLACYMNRETRNASQILLETYTTYRPMKTSSVPHSPSYKQQHMETHTNSIPRIHKHQLRITGYFRGHIWSYYHNQEYKRKTHEQERASNCYNRKLAKKRGGMPERILRRDSNF
jgi:hypothetical protein